MEHRCQQLPWIAGIAAASLLLTYIAVDRLRLPRDLFVLCHVVLTGALLAAYAVRTELDPAELVGRWKLGLAGALVTGAMMVVFVLGGPGSPPPTGAALLWALGWLGIVYGAIDALLLSVFPVIAVHRLSGGKVWSDGHPQAWAVVALGACLLLTAAYHLGFPEFRGWTMRSALIGNGVMTLGYLATRSALTPVLAHIALHMAAVVYGYANALPAPPHY